MAKNDNLTDFLQNIADTIRAKRGITGPISAQNFAAEIAAIEGGGTSTPDMPVIGDGKTYLYIKIAAEGRMTVPLCFSQTKANGVAIDWGDGSATQTLSGTGSKNTTHKYASIGDYCITLSVAVGCTLGLGSKSSSYCVLGITSNNGRVYCNMLQRVEIGSGVTSIDTYAFSNCYSLASVVIPNSVTSINSYAFSNCYSLASVVIPNSVTKFYSHTFYNCYSLASVVIPNSVPSIESQMFQNCYSLASVVIPNSVTKIFNHTFNSCYGMAFYDFSALTAVPSLSATNAFSSIPSDCKIIVPDALYDEWIAATNWSTYASQTIKKSEWDALNA